MQGRIDYFIHGLYIGRTQFRAMGMLDQVTDLKPAINDGQVHHAFSGKSDCKALVPLFDRRMKEMREDGSVARLINEYSHIWAKNFSNPN